MTYINPTRTTLAPPLDASRLDAPRDASREQRLRQVVGQLEGVFVEQLFKAMRETVPKGGIGHGGAGEEMFTGLLDQHVAGAVPAQMQGGLGEALFQQLRPTLGTLGAGAPDGGSAAPDVDRAAPVAIEETRR